MSQSINIHLPPGVTNLDQLSLSDFVSQTKTVGTVKTTDLYYHPSAPKTLKESFLKKLSDFSARLNGHWKPAMNSENLERAMSNIYDKPYMTSKAEMQNRFSDLMKLTAGEGGGLTKTGTFITLVNAEDNLIINEALKKVMAE